MKKWLLISGVGLAGFGLYRYFRHQVDLALNYNYKLKDIRIEKIEGKDITLNVTMNIQNKSNFSILVSQYDIDLFFKGVKFAKTVSKTPLRINPTESFDLKARGIINMDNIKQAAVPFVQDVINRKPIDIQVSGFVKVVFMGFPSTIDFDKKTINYSLDLLKDYKLDTAFEKLKTKYPKLFAIFSN